MSDYKKINLVNNGIFPITVDKHGIPLDQELDTDMSVNSTIQGEGMYSGIPSFFIRTSGCNLNCAWLGADGNGSPCDTPYSSHYPEKNQQTVEDIFETIMANVRISNTSHVIISGGEPFIQSDRLTPLARMLNDKGIQITIETNGTIYDANLMQYVKLISISPKLSSSTPWESHLKNTGIDYSPKIAERHNKNRKNLTSISKLIVAAVSNLSEYQLKFVVSKPSDVDEIIQEFYLPLKVIIDEAMGFEVLNPTDVLLMPEGVTPESFKTKDKWVIESCLRYGFRFSPRLHAMYFGVKRGV